MNYKVRILSESIKFYLPRTEGYLEIIRRIAQEYAAMSLIEFDGYFEGKFEPTKYMRVEVHVNDVKEDNLIEFANKIRIMLKQYITLWRIGYIICKLHIIKCDFLSNNSFPMREWHVEHMEKTIVKFVTGLSENASNWQRRQHNRYGDNNTLLQTNKL